MAKSKRRSSSRRNLNRLLIVSVWVLLLLLIGYFVVAYALRNRARAQEIERRNASLSLETVVLPDGCPDEVIHYIGFTVHFNPRDRVANCAVYELTAEEAAGELPREGAFYADTSVPSCPAPTDYKGSGYSRGHLVPAGDLKWNVEAMRNSFVMTNVCPQSEALNNGAWNRLEMKVREWAKRDGTLVIVAGPIFDRKTYLDSGVALPTHFFKVILAPKVSPARAIAFIYPNEKCSAGMEHYVVTVDEVESRTGIDFFADLDDEMEAQVEAESNIIQWLHK